MSNVITLYDTYTYSQNQLIEAPLAELLQSRYFGTDPARDTFEAREVVMDFADPELEAGPMVYKGYIDGRKIEYYSTTCEPPRIAPEYSIDVQGRDRLLFEQLSYPQGEHSPTRADAFQALTRIVAQRLVGKVNRSIEKLCASVLVNNAVIGQIPTSPTDNTPVDIEVRYYEKSNGNQQRFSPNVAWGQSGAQPYKDVCAMVNELTSRGTMPDDLLISPEAYDLLRQDEDFKSVFPASVYVREGELFAKEINRARHVGTVSFGGWMLNIIVYNGAYRNEAGVMTPYLPKGFVCVIKSNCGRTLCGGSTLVNAQALGDDLSSSFVSKRGKYCASKFVDVRNQMLTVRCESRPLPAPHASWQWLTMDAGNSNSISGGSQGPVAQFLFYADSADVDLPDTITAKAGTKVKLTAPTLTDYTFSHWEFDDAELVLDNDSKFTVPAEGGVIEAVFVSVITFEGGTGGVQYPQAIRWEEKANLDAVTLSKGENAFLGWSLTNGGEVAYENQAEIYPQGDMTLYAVFE